MGRAVEQIATYVLLALAAYPGARAIACDLQQVRQHLSVDFSRRPREGPAAMHGASEIIRAIGSLWPLAAIAAIIWFRKGIVGGAASIVAAMRGWVKSVKAGPIELQLWEVGISGTRASLTAADAPESIDDDGDAAPDWVEFIPTPSSSMVDDYATLAKIAPVAAIIQAHDELERTLRAMLAGIGAGDGVPETANATTLARRLYGAGQINASLVPAVDGLTALRNLAFAEQASTPQRAGEYLALADGVMFALRQPPKSAE